MPTTGSARPGRGKEYRRSQELGPSTDPDAFGFAANASRRHLSTDQKRDLIRRVLAVRPTLSNRQLACLVGVSGPIVRAEQRSTAKASQLNTKGADTPRDIVAHDDRS